MSDLYEWGAKFVITDDAQHKRIQDALNGAALSVAREQGVSIAESWGDIRPLPAEGAEPIDVGQPIYRDGWE